MRHFAILTGLKAIQQAFQRKIALIKMFKSQTSHHNYWLRLETPNYINVVLFYPFIPKVREHDMKKIRKGEKAVEEKK